MREKEGFRDQYTVLKERFPGKEAISLNETCAVLGISRYQAAKLIKDKKKPFPAINRSGTYIIPLAGLARYMS